ncbi:MAG: hypothetical protein NC393_10315 [Clostridium sp.]|nr:hypothetical protein [Clostridium sp.]MCM1207496.1 hypothetical protein [Ruminococcus sp.]
MNRSFSVALTVVLAIVLTGCSEKSEVTETTTSVYVQENTLLQEYSLFQSEPVVFDSDYAMPIVKNGTLYGQIKINFAEKLGIWDLSNYKANQNGVRFSYAINCSIDMQDYVVPNEMINVILTPEILGYDSSVVGTSGYVGWSGYPESAELYENTVESNFEVVLQPIVPEREKWKYLVFHLADATNQIQFDDLYVDLKCLDNAPDGAHLLTINDTARISSINGASYTIQFHDVYLEQHKVKGDSKYRDGTYKFYDFQYDVTYDTAVADGSRSVLSFDSFNNFAITALPVMEVYSDTDDTKLYDPNHNAQRLVYSDRSITENYTWDFPGMLQFGETCTVSTNRMIQNDNSVKPAYVRVVLKFPSEAKARDFNEMRNFNGRYLVYQLPLDVRTLEVAPR